MFELQFVSLSNGETVELLTDSIDNPEMELQRLTGYSSINFFLKEIYDKTNGVYVYAPFKNIYYNFVMN
jgi:hypothetical protein